MAKTIIHHNGAYNLYDTISDRAYFERAISLRQLQYFIQKEYGDSGLRELPERLERTHTKGTSAHEDDSLAETLCCNRAGPNETEMTINEFIEKYLTLATKC